MNSSTVPPGAIVSPMPLARKCLRCGHFECPCCVDYCDTCFTPSKEDCAAETLVGWMIEQPGERVLAISRRCAEGKECVYDSAPDEQAHESFWSQFSDDDDWNVGVLDDGRVWCAPVQDFGDDK